MTIFVCDIERKIASFILKQIHRFIWRDDAISVP